jgi:hypothetical protein
VSRPRLLDLFCGAGGAAMGYTEWIGAHLLRALGDGDAPPR